MWGSGMRILKTASGRCCGTLEVRKHGSEVPLDPGPIRKQLCNCGKVSRTLSSANIIYKMGTIISNIPQGCGTDEGGL